MHWGKMALGIVALVVITGAGVFYQAGAWHQHSFVGDKASLSAMWRTLLLAFATLVGIASGVTYKLLAADGSLQLADRPVTHVYLSGMFRPMLASPLIFMFVYSTAREIPDIIIAAMLAFENGFFCESILARRPDMHT